MKQTESHPAVYSGLDGTGDMVYEASFSPESSFGQIGAVRVENRYSSEVYISDIKLDRLLGSRSEYSSGADAVTFHCDSWFTYRSGHNKRVFFPPKVCRTPTESRTNNHAHFA